MVKAGRETTGAGPAGNDAQGTPHGNHTSASCLWAGFSGCFTSVESNEAILVSFSLDMSARSIQACAPRGLSPFHRRVILHCECSTCVCQCFIHRWHLGCYYMVAVAGSAAVTMGTPVCGGGHKAQSRCPSPGWCLWDAPQRTPSLVIQSSRTECLTVSWEGGG